MIEGHIDLTAFDLFHNSLDYELIQDGRTGFNFAVSAHEAVYDLKSLQVAVSRDVPDDFLTLVQSNFDMESIAHSVQKMSPGMILPYHSDKYGYYRSQRPGVEIEDIKRVIVFLEDWKPGHISEIAGESHSNWKRGDWISWTGSTIHLAANLGFEDRYSLQLTGIIK